ncbi:hypothetical protein LHYA1_G001626 [Lachnellula hyalina]|uniref:Uncharacterized protein n=1 Tax=Lachnellula hyalina TaxID=1316788 RepID=A0A8H8R8C5_9HELO|nr:uncharacterized protein LHYA1_G001626 [Lachnellula hyalina]TVY30305.1 hypothetical protein LHYA1_G001626 [Lachnellula hyalina]
MLLARPLPPQFLLPAWNARQLAGAHAVLHQHQQQRACKSDDTSSQNKEDTRFNWNSNKDTNTSSTTDTKNPNPSSLSRSTSDTETRPSSTGDSKGSTHSLRRTVWSIRRDSRDLQPAKTTAALSLFEELFPEEGEAKKKAEERKEKPGRLPAFDWNKTISGDGNENNVKLERERLQKEFRNLPSQTPVALSGNSLRAEDPQPGYLSEKEAEDGERGRRREASVLVLNSATKTLEESDFFRVGPRGEHIEGWTIIPGRDNNTLRPLGHYFILFYNDVAAKAYLDSILRIWRIAKQRSAWASSNIPGVRLPPGMLKDGEDIQKLVKSFTLVPPYSRLFLRMLSKPYKPAMLRLLDEGGPGAIAARETKTENMVLITSDIGVFDPQQLLKAIRDDGTRRNLHWKLVLSKDRLIQLKDDPVVNGMEEEMGGSPKLKQRTLRPPARYVLSFKDRHEARRFVREWHKRSMPEKKNPRPGEELPPVINAEILW